MASDLDQFAARLGRALRAFRKERGWTQADVVERLGGDVAFETISRFERASAVPSFAWIARLAQVYGVTMDDILEVALATRPGANASARRQLVEGVLGLEEADAMVVCDLVTAYAASVSRRRGGRDSS
ncbi:MAG: Helix-turn-helix domain [Pseudomonadota bacterium]|jgi:transcriptional regulator with XRE-family HTH domain